ncbi:MAG: metallophosphoesterase [Hyphomicrobiales bacterium]|jgi:predicted MPP superfamily phosphohydrolase
MITRRQFLALFGGTVAGATALGGYAFGYSPLRAPKVTEYTLSPPRWPEDLNLRIAVIADVHACKPWMSADRIASIAEATNSLGADVIVLLGDFVAGHVLVTGQVPWQDWADALAALNAPLGVHAILGNHDWWEDPQAMASRSGPTFAHTALQRAGIALYENDAVQLHKDGKSFWLAGLGDQLAFLPAYRWNRAAAVGLDDLPGTLAKITDDDPVILLAHEPDIFPQIPDRVSLTLCGHTHGGQVRLLGYSPVVPSQFGNRFAYGHVIEDERHMIVSGGLGCSIMPVRFGMPPELVVINLGNQRADIA